MQTYRAAMEPFASWYAAHGIKNAGQITEALASAYLKEREQLGLSAWTVSRDMAAINKVLVFDLSKKNLACVSGVRQKSPAAVCRPQTTVEDFQNMLTRLRLPKPPESVVHL